MKHQFKTPTLHVDGPAAPSTDPKYFAKSGTFYKRTYIGQAPQTVKDWQFQPDSLTWVRIERIPNHCQRIKPNALPIGANSDRIAAIRALRGKELKAEKEAEDRLFASVRFSTLARIAKLFGGAKRGKRRVSRPLEGIGTQTATAPVGANPHVKCVYKKRSV